MVFGLFFVRGLLLFGALFGIHLYLPMNTWIFQRVLNNNNKGCSIHHPLGFKQHPLKDVDTPPKFNSSPLKNGGWKKDPFLLGFGNFSGDMLNFGRVGVCLRLQLWVGVSLT